MDTSAGSNQRATWPRVVGMLILLGGGALLAFRLLAPPAPKPPDSTGLLTSDDPPEGVLLLFTPAAKTPPEEPPASTLTPTPLPVIVYISGEVLLPGVYELPPHARVNDVVMAAGGLTENADRNHINLAAYIHDAQHIHIPRLGEPTPSAAVSENNGSVAGTTSPSSPAGAININHATKKELQQLEGIGEVLSQRIVDYRATNGPFQSVDDLQQVPHISSALVEKIRPHITVEQ